jgi:radical SAM superfamily enzyme YgiQ (UPF0313 family)
MKKLALVGINTRHTHSSLSLACLQAYWERISGRPGLLRLDYDQNQGTEALISRLILLKPPLAAFSVYIWNIQQVLAVSGALKAALPDTRIILGGPEISYETLEVMAAHPWIDAVICGEGELTFEEVLERHLAGGSLAGVAGTIWRDGAHLVTEKPRELLQNLDLLPSPFRAGLYGRGLGFTYYEASRGCPFRCSYCLSSVLGPLRNLSLERVCADLDWFFQSDYTQVRFADRTFNYDIPRAVHILEYILRHNARNLSFHFELKPDLLSDDVLTLLGEAPADVFHLEIGVQSTDPHSLREVNRSPDVEKIARCIRRLREKTRCHIHIDLLAGMPGETFPAFKQSLDETFTWNTDTIQVGLVKALKGTALRERAKKGELVVAPFAPYPVVRSNWLSAEEVIRCQDIGRMVEGVFNPGRFAIALRMIIRNLFRGVPSAFFEALAHFWRRTEKPFYSFGAETVRNGLREFLVELGPLRTREGELEQDHDGVALSCDPALYLALEAVLLHEFRLNQKVPSGSPGPAPALTRPVGGSIWKLRPGTRVFWYETDPLPYEADPTFVAAAACRAPVVYTYETDLSKSPRTGFLALPYLERVFLAGIESYATCEEFAEYLGRHGLTGSATPPLVEEMIEKFSKTDILIRQKPRH